MIERDSVLMINAVHLGTILQATLCAMGGYMDASFASIQKANPSPMHGATSVLTMPGELRVCPKCRGQLLDTAFKLRSRAQGLRPSWCKICRNQQDRTRRARQRQRALNECLRRIRRNSPPDRVRVLFVASAQLAGGFASLAKLLQRRLESNDISTAIRAASLLGIIFLSCGTGTVR